MIFAVPPYLVTPYRPTIGALHKNDTVLDACLAHPERFLVSPRSGDPRVLVARTLTSPDNAAWEVWQNDTFRGILVLDRIVPQLEARLQFVFFDDELASKADLLRDFTQRCFAELHLTRLTFEAPARMKVLTDFARRKLGFAPEGARVRAYHDGLDWDDVAVLGLVRA